MTSLLDAARSFLESESWPHEAAADRPILRMTFEGESGRWVCYAHARDDLGVLAFYSVLSEEAPPERRGALAELFARINHGLVVGDFELDMDDGNLRFRTAVDFEGGAPAAHLVRNLVLANVVTMDRYRPAILAVLGGERPVDALGRLRG